MAALNSDTSSDGGGAGRLKVYSRRRYHHRQLHIPEDIVILILSRLPVKSLLQFRVAQKVAVRTAHGLCDDHSGVVYSIDDDVVYSSSRIRQVSNDKNLEWFQILGSCNGLLLVSHYADLYLWNPSTRQCTKVLSLPSGDDGEGVYDVEYGPGVEVCTVEDGLRSRSGLCYDSSRDDYKAVMACNRKAKPSYSVASFRRKKMVTTTCRFVDKMKSGPVVNEKLHWAIFRCGDNGFETDGIVCFDPVTEEFEELPAPPGFRGVNKVILGLGVFDGCLCMARLGCGAEVEPGVIELFVMREYGVRESWSRISVTSIFMESTKLYKYGSLVPLCFTKNGEVLVVVDKSQLFVYNPDKNSQKEIPVPSDRYTIDVPYMESLASPAAYGHEEDWDEEGEDADKFVKCIGFCFECYYSWDSLVSRWRKVPVIIAMMWKGYGKTESVEKFKRRFDRARPKFLAEKEEEKVKRLVED